MEFPYEDASTFIRRSEGSRWVPLSYRLPADSLTPVMIFNTLYEPARRSAFLDSMHADGHLCRYSFIALDPLVTFEAWGENSCARWKDGTKEEHQKNPLDSLRQLIRTLQLPEANELPPLAGGAIGYVGYDAIRWRESLPDRHPPDPDLPDVSLSFYQTYILYDHLRSSLILTRFEEIEKEPMEGYEKASSYLKRLLARLEEVRGGAFLRPCQGIQIAPQADLDDQAFAKKVKESQKYIRTGDVFQIVLSRTFSSPYPASPFALFRALRTLNPSPYLFYLDQENLQIAGSSPERLVSLHRGYLETMPLAGTRPRGATPEEDLHNEQNLLSDPKECAEHMMLVDLGRNDLGRVARPGSVHVTELAQVVRYSHVMHLRSRVAATLRSDLDGLDALLSVLPAGTLSGAPKVRAMELIDQLESSRRGVYGGAILYLSPNGDLDSCIAIRMALLRKGRIEVRTGAGILMESDPLVEAQETRQKAEVLFRAMEIAAERFEDS